MNTHTLTCTLQRSTQHYTYTCSPEAWSDAAVYVREQFANHSVVAVVDDAVRQLYGERIEHLFGTHPRWCGIINVPQGEASKSRSEKDRIEDELFALQCGRDTLILAIGGGVVGDLAGYVAATFNRGVPLVHLPTTLLAMVDSSIGGKAGINHAAGKNLLGAFYQPHAIFAELNTLATVSETEFTSGMAEVLKYAATLDIALWEQLECSADAVRRRDARLLQAIIVRSAALKIGVVQADEQESNLRAILNFGHTVGHAFELLSHYGIPHGFGVAAGMRVALRLSEQLLGYPTESVRRFDALLEQYNLKHEYSSRFAEEDVWNAVLLDKKSRYREPRFVLMKTPTEYVLAHPVRRKELDTALQSVLG